MNAGRLINPPNFLYFEQGQDIQEENAKKEIIPDKKRAQKMKILSNKDKLHSSNFQQLIKPFL